MIVQGILGTLAGLSLALLLWQWLAGRRFPLHQRTEAISPAPAVTLLKPLKGCDETTADSLRSWLAQEYRGPVQVLFGVAKASDPVCEVVQRLLAEFPQHDAQLIVCSDQLGANAKVSKLVELERQAKHGILLISDADVRVPPDFLTNVVGTLSGGAPPATSNRQTTPAGAWDGPGDSRQIGLVNCFYRLAEPATLAMQWEAIAVNADFWSQVLQSANIRPLDFALGAVMVTRRAALHDIGGFPSLVDCLADDYQLGHRLAQRGGRIALATVVVECWSPPVGWREVWRHQLRWARTIRVCQPAPYFFSLLSNATLWPLLWLVAAPSATTAGAAAGCVLARVLAAWDLQQRLTRNRTHWRYGWLVPVKDLLQAALWLGAFAGNRVEWRGERYRLKRDGTLVRSRTHSAAA